MMKKYINVSLKPCVKLKYCEAIALRGLAKSFGSVPIEDFEKEQKAITDKRISRQKERIFKLKNSLKS